MRELQECSKKVSNLEDRFAKHKEGVAKGNQINSQLIAIAEKANSRGDFLHDLKDVAS